MDDIQLTVSGDTAEVLLQLGHVKRGIKGFRVNLFVAESSSGKVGIGGVKAGGGDAAGYLQQDRRGPALTLKKVLSDFIVILVTCRDVLTSLL